MLTCTTWKARAITPEQSSRMMDVWGKLEAATEENSAIERICWFIFADGSGGVTVERTDDPETAIAFGLETSLALGEFLELDSRVCLDLDSAMPAIIASMDRIGT
jgi:3-oxoacyl-[acyl-carrier-protein] synthase III